ncbi:SAM-dependent methyltransferase [Candidatus Woesearchaeota archaeon]|jgi:hypothetical protein|nr:SAM-dependent methyltransferase [Candidatus Woesearchaeota archaeon]
MDNISKVSGSFRDPNGFLFFESEVLYRQINKSYKDNYELLMNSGLYNNLVKLNLLVSHQEVDKFSFEDDFGYKIIQPEIIPFVSYPYEWSFSQLKDAALLTLKILKKSLDYGMVIKDASAYNIQFIGSNPIFIDTLSFEKYVPGKPWEGYKQFCQHFLAPLALMSYRDDRLNTLLRSYIDGIPLDLANSLLPTKSKFKAGIIFHLSLHSKALKRYSDKNIQKEKGKNSFGELQFKGIINSLEKAIKNLPKAKRNTEWDTYYSGNCNYDDVSLLHKKELVKEFVKKVSPKMVWDLGANDGFFSDITSDNKITTIAFDVDFSCVERNYLRQKNNKNGYQLPLLLDLTNPSPNLGWGCDERNSLINRGPVDLVFALALIHHLAISNNVPLSKIAHFFSKACKYLIIEFVPKEDSQVKKLLSSRKDIFTEYYIDHFEKEFNEFFTIVEKKKINSSCRTLYLMEKKSNNL